jgi:MSHA pilin protein MshA
VVRRKNQSKVQKMKQSQGGFTLIELVMVIVILGVLAAVALPKFVNLKDDASQAAVQGVAGALASASAVNYSARSLGSTSTAYASTTAVTNCTSVASALQGGLPANYVISAAVVANGGSQSCTLTGPTADGGKTATFTALGIN